MKYVYWILMSFMFQFTVFVSIEFNIRIGKCSTDDISNLLWWQFTFITRMNFISIWMVFFFIEMNWTNQSKFRECVMQGHLVCVVNIIIWWVWMNDLEWKLRCDRNLKHKFRNFFPKNGLRLSNRIARLYQQQNLRWNWLGFYWLV